MTLQDRLLTLAAKCDLIQSRGSPGATVTPWADYANLLREAAAELADANRQLNNAAELMTEMRKERDEALEEIDRLHLFYGEEVYRRRAQAWLLKEVLAPFARIPDLVHPNTPDSYGVIVHPNMSLGVTLADCRKAKGAING